MIALGRLASKLLICLTAAAMPFQAGWASDCGCPSALEGESASNATAPLACCQAATARPACCEMKATCSNASKSRPTCCCRTVGEGRPGGCQCGPSCHCADRNNSPPLPSAPAPENGRSQSEVNLIASHVAVADLPFSDGDSNACTADPCSAFCLPGTQICVLLCRFTL